MRTLFVRTLIVYLIVLIVMRLMGKRQVGQLQPFELVIALMVADLSTVPLSDIGIPLMHSVIPMFAILIMHQSISHMMMLWPRMRTLICGKPSIIITEGKIDDKELGKQRVNLDDLIEQLRSQGFLHIDDIESAVLEPSGTLSVIPTAQKRPVTAEDLKLQVEREELPLSLIMDGRLYGDNLKKSGRDRDWLKRQLYKKNLNLRQVLIALYYPKTDKLSIQAKEKSR